jgi:hypothetical protein
MTGESHCLFALTSLANRNAQDVDLQDSILTHKTVSGWCTSVAAHSRTRSSTLLVCIHALSLSIQRSIEYHSHKKALLDKLVLEFDRWVSGFESRKLGALRPSVF